MLILLFIIPFTSVWVRFLFEKLKIQKRLKESSIKIISEWSKCLFCYFTWINIFLTGAHCLYYQEWQYMFCVPAFAFLAIHFFNKYMEILGEEAQDG